MPVPQPKPIFNLSIAPLGSGHPGIAQTLFLHKCNCWPLKLMFCLFPTVPWSTGKLLPLPILHCLWSHEWISSPTSLSPMSNVVAVDWFSKAGSVLPKPDFPLSSAHCSLSKCLITSICKQYTFNQGLHICHTHSLSQMCSLPLGIKILFFYIMLTYLCRPLSSCLCLETLYSSFHLHVYNEFPLLGSSSFCMCQLLTVFSMKKTMHSDSKEFTWAAAVR